MRDSKRGAAGIRHQRHEYEFLGLGFKFFVRIRQFFCAFSHFKIPWKLGMSHKAHKPSTATSTPTKAAIIPIKRELVDSVSWWGYARNHQEHALGGMLMLEALLCTPARAGNDVYWFYSLIAICFIFPIYKYGNKRLSLVSLMNFVCSSRMQSPNGASLLFAQTQECSSLHPRYRFSCGAHFVSGRSFLTSNQPYAKGHAHQAREILPL
jgi:hypothetical protein